MFEWAEDLLKNLEILTIRSTTTNNKKFFLVSLRYWNRENDDIAISINMGAPFDFREFTSYAKWKSLFITFGGYASELWLMDYSFARNYLKHRIDTKKFSRFNFLAFDEDHMLEILSFLYTHNVGIFSFAIGTTLMEHDVHGIKVNFDILPSNKINVFLSNYFLIENTKKLDYIFRYSVIYERSVIISIMRVIFVNNNKNNSDKTAIDSKNNINSNIPANSIPIDNQSIVTNGFYVDFLLEILELVAGLVQTHRNTDVIFRNISLMVFYRFWQMELYFILWIRVVFFLLQFAIDLNRVIVITVSFSSVMRVSDSPFKSVSAIMNHSQSFNRNDEPQ